VVWTASRRDQVAIHALTMPRLFDNLSAASTPEAR
jgi:hypothetical protein